MKMYKIQNRSPKVSHACVPLVPASVVSFFGKFCTEINVFLIPVQGIGNGMLNWLQEVQ